LRAESYNKWDEIFIRIADGATEKLITTASCGRGSQRRYLLSRIYRAATTGSGADQHADNVKPNLALRFSMPRDLAVYLASEEPGFMHGDGTADM
jgi:hypothetical protein